MGVEHGISYSQRLTKNAGNCQSDGKVSALKLSPAISILGDK